MKLILTTCAMCLNTCIWLGPIHRGEIELLVFWKHAVDQSVPRCCSASNSALPSWLRSRFVGDVGVDACWFTGRMLFTLASSGVSGLKAVEKHVNGCGLSAMSL